MTDVQAQKRNSGRASGLALLLFLAVYVAALVVLLAPRGAFTTPASQIASGD